MKYIAQIRARNGRLLFQTAAHDDREAAADAAFRQGPASAQTCSTSEACQDRGGAWRSTGIDIRWHRRDQFRPRTVQARAPAMCLLAAEREILAPSFRHVARFRHVDFWNAPFFNEHVFPFLSVALGPHQLVIIPRRAGAPSRQWKCGCNFRPLILGQLRDLRRWNKASLCLLAILRLLKRLFQILPVGFRGAILVARIDHCSCKQTGERSHYGETRHRRRNFKLKFVEDVNPDRHGLTQIGRLWSSQGAITRTFAVQRFRRYRP
jgi:hypothetical protein